ncbi:hypothetical protein BLA27_11015 [Brucella cytisi]|uniref:Uncharacterized protein n=1 Tax=Brucella cytisi TaxID=407152 RepID=A0A1J6HM64_9HYPH|nr:hypothetical protein BLA27_11015 [Brucella cytisi]
MTAAKVDASEHIVMPCEPDAEIHAISANVGVAASPIQPDALLVSLDGEPTFPITVRIGISASPIELPFPAVAIQ